MILSSSDIAKSDHDARVVGGSSGAARGSALAAAASGHPAGVVVEDRRAVSVSVQRSSLSLHALSRSIDLFTHWVAQHHTRTVTALS